MMHRAQPTSGSVGKVRRRDRDQLRVLVVEDDADAAEMMGLALTGRGYDVWLTSDARSALSAIEDESPDVILIDIGLPDMDGFCLAEAIRERGHENVRLVALTGYGATEDKRRAEEAGFDRHLVKPAPLDAIVAALDEDH